MKSAEKNPWESRSFSLPCAAIGFFTRITTSLFGHIASTSQSSDHIPENGNETEILLQNESSDIPCEPYPNELQTLGKTNLNQEVEENPEKEEFKAFKLVRIQKITFRRLIWLVIPQTTAFLVTARG